MGKAAYIKYDIDQNQPSKPGLLDVDPAAPTNAILRMLEKGWHESEKAQARVIKHGLYELVYQDEEGTQVMKWVAERERYYRDVRLYDPDHSDAMPIYFITFAEEDDHLIEFIVAPTPSATK